MKKSELIDVQILRLQNVVRRHGGKATRAQISIATSRWGRDVRDRALAEAVERGVLRLEKAAQRPGQPGFAATVVTLGPAAG